jgi:hypothetical protein
MGERVYKREEQIVCRKVAGETLLVPVRGRLAHMQQIFSLDPVAAYIWEALDGEKKLEDIQEGILDTFDVKKEQAESDMLEFIDELLKAGLIVAVA